MPQSSNSSMHPKTQRLSHRWGQLHASWPALLMTLLLAGWAQWALDERKHLLLAFAAYVVGAALFAWLVKGVALERKTEAEEEKSPPVLVVPVVVALLLGGLSFPLFKGNRFSASGVALWVGGGLLLLWGLGCFADISLRARWKRWGAVAREGRISVSVDLFALIGIMAVGAFYRWYRLSEVPLEMGCDLPLIYDNVKQILQGRYLVFFPSHPGREGLFFYLVAPYARLFGLSHYAIKSVCAGVGLLTVPMVYLLGRALYGRRAGLFAAALLAISKWHIMLSRTGFRAIVMPLCVTLLWYFLVRGAESGERKHFLWAGFIMGLGLYTYNAFLIVPFGVLLCLALHSLADRGKFVRQHWTDISWMYGVMLFVFIPLGRYAYESPNSYLFRVLTRVSSVETSLPGNVLLVLLDNIRKTALMFNLYGDIVFISNVPFQRHLGYISAIAFVLGLACCLARWRRGYNAMTLGFLIFTVTPTILSIAFPHEVPSAVRSNAAVIPAVVLGALAFALFSRCAAEKVKPGAIKKAVLGVRIASGVNWRVTFSFGGALRLAPSLVLAGALLYETVGVYPTYFEEYVSHLPAKNYSISLALARVIDDFADDGESYVVAQPYWYDGNALRAQLRVEEHTWHNELWDLAPDQPPLSDVRGKVLFIVHPADKGSLGILRAAFPKGVALDHRDFDGNVSFIAFYGQRD